jgi:hypothetical protein
VGPLWEAVLVSGDGRWLGKQNFPDARHSPRGFITQAMETSMTNRQQTIVVKPLDRALIDTWQLLENRRRAIVAVSQGKTPRRSDLGVLLTIKRG